MSVISLFQIWYIKIFSLPINYTGLSTVFLMPYFCYYLLSHTHPSYLESPGNRTFSKMKCCINDCNQMFLQNAWTPSLKYHPHTHTQTDVVWLHLYEVSRVVKSIETESRMAVLLILHKLSFLCLKSIKASCFGHFFECRIFMELPYI